MAVILPLCEDWKNRATEVRELKKCHCDDQFVCDVLERIAQEFDQLAVYAGGEDSFLHRRIDSIDFGPCLTVRIQNVCNNYVASDWGHFKNTPRPIATVADLVRMTEGELLREPNFGRKSLDAVERVLAEHGLRLGMKLAEELHA
jgi:Bacterial RNA polymerase, alpha chain C terminal domain